jgi:small subunit ribosomal protein S9
MAEEIKKTSKKVVKEKKEIKTSDKKIKEVDGAEEIKDFSGKFVAAVGKRKSSVAKVRLYENGKGTIVVNDKKSSQYFSVRERNIISQPIKLTGAKNFDFSIVVDGGGKNGQAEATRHGIVKALIAYNKDWRPSLKAKGWITRDPRVKERKKPGLKKARKAPQWSKR